MKKRSQTFFWTGLLVLAAGSLLYYGLHLPSWIRIVASLMAAVLFAVSLVLAITARRAARQRT
jgi:hypothetical protein